MNLRTVFGFLQPRLLYSSRELPHEDFPLPERVIVLIGSEHKDKGLKLKVGDGLKSGQRILSDSGDRVGISPATGKVKSIGELSWIGEEYTTVEIETSEDIWEGAISGDTDFLGKGKKELLSRLQEAGFDTGIYQDKRERVIVNCLESDLLISNSKRILKDRDTIKEGVELLRRLTGSDKVVLAVTKEDSGLTEGIAEALIIEPVYPNGMEQELERIHSGDGGKEDICIVGVEYLKGMVEALRTGRPFTEKLITLIRGGNPIKSIRVRIGTPVSEILRANKISLGENERLILGGPMRGKAVYHTEFPIREDTDGVLIQGISEIAEISNKPCCNCGICVKVCPYNLQVNLLSRYSEFSIFERCKELDIDYCIECGLCSYVCTSRRPLVQYIQFAKRELR